MFGYVVAGSVGLILVFWTLMPDPSPRCGVYVQPNKWYPFKYAFFRFLLWLRRRRNRAMKQTTGEQAGYGVRSRSTPEDMDKVQELPKDKPLVSWSNALNVMLTLTPPTPPPPPYITPYSLRITLSTAYTRTHARTHTHAHTHTHTHTHTPHTTQHNATHTH